MAAGVTGILLASLGSVVSLCARAMPDRAADKALIASNAQDGLSMLADDLSGAISIVSASPTDLSFRVMDPGVPGQIAVVRYWWDAITGKPMYRTWNGRAQISAIPALSQFTLSYDWRSFGTSTASGSTLGSSTGLAHCLNASGGTFTIGLTPKIAQVVTPSLRATATAWKPAKVRVKASLGLGLLSSMYAKIYQGDSSNLGSQTLLATSVSVTALSGGDTGWMDFTFSGAPEVAAGQSVTIVFGSLVSLGSTVVTFSASGVPDSQACCATTSNGTTWTVQSDGAIAYELYGQVRSPLYAADTESRLAGVWIDLTPTGSGVLPVHSLVRTAAYPKVE